MSRILTQPVAPRQSPCFCVDSAAVDEQTERALQLLEVEDRPRAKRLRAVLATDDLDRDGLCELADAMVRLEDGDAAVAAWMKVVSADPACAPAWHGLGDLFEQVGALAEAVDCFSAAVEAAPTAQRHARLARVLQASGRAVPAANAYQAALALDRGLAAAWFNLGGILVGTGQLVEAARCYEEVTGIDGQHRRAWCNLGVVRRQQGALPSAERALRRAVELDPGYALALANLASVLETLNRVGEAAALADRALEADPDSCLAGLVRARVHRRRAELEPARARIDRAISAAPDPELKGRALVESGMLRDRLGESDAAFAAWSQGQRLLGALPVAAAIDRAAWPALVERIRWATDRLLALPPAPRDDGPAPVFMVGFPRSGTTLTEQLLASHPGLVTAEERPFLDRALAGSGYPDREPDPAAIRRGWREQTAHVARPGLPLVDKLPLNLVHAAAISRAFPDARLVVSLRDPRDVCLSCFAQDFVPNEAMAQFFDLERTAALYAAVMSLWLELRERLEIPWLEVRYEDLVADLPTSARRLIDFLGLPWHEGVLRYHEEAAKRTVLTPSHQDVCQPIFTRARGRWRRYEQHLTPILPVLAPYLAAFDYA
jgi:tetratricopeptide (TPR) repeat protein